VNRPEQHEEIQQMLSAFLDDELTQADNQRVRLHLEDCEECRLAFAQMKELQRLTSEMKFNHPPEATMERLQQKVSVQAPRKLGWGLVVIGLIAWVIYIVVLALRNPRWPTLPELLLGAVYVGLLLVFLSVLRQRVLERPHDRYRKVKK